MRRMLTASSPSWSAMASATSAIWSSESVGLIFPLMFLSGIFVPVAGLPSPLREFAEINPLTALATAMRELFHVPTGPLPDVWTLQHPVLTTLGWVVVLMGVFGPLAIRRYQRMGR
jgi:ABC-2 type transport system permease protein